MASQTSTRLWRAFKAAKRPWPQLDDDDVIDYQIMEAVAIKADKEEAEAIKTREIRKAQQHSLETLEQFR